MLLLPLPLSRGFLLSSYPSVCNHILNFTGRPHKGFLVFGEPDSFWCDFRHAARWSLITFLWWGLCVFMWLRVCVCWKWFCFPSHACSSANKSYQFTGKWYWKCQWYKGMPVLLIFLSVLVISYCWDMTSGMSLSLRGPGCLFGLWWNSGWMCGPQAKVSCI